MTSSRDIAQTLIRLAKEGNDSGKVVEWLNAYVREHGLEYKLQSIMRHLAALAHADADTESLRITSAYPLTDATLERIKQYVGAAKNTAVKMHEDTDTIGGFVALYKGKVYNASMKEQLVRLKNTLSIVTTH